MRSPPFARRRSWRLAGSPIDVFGRLTANQFQAGGTRTLVAQYVGFHLTLLWLSSDRHSGAGGLNAKCMPRDHGSEAELLPEPANFGVSPSEMTDASEIADLALGGALDRTQVRRASITVTISKAVHSRAADLSRRVSGHDMS